MSSYTYEFENRCEQLETYEWDNVWMEHADKEGIQRVLYIGDSISCATRTVATRIADGKLFFDGVGTSKALDNPYFADTIRLFAGQERERCAVLFNNGLHGWHLDDETQYKEAYENMILFLRREFESTPLFLVLTTHVRDCARDARVVARNRVVLELAEKYDLPVIDAYAITKKHEEFLSADGVHWLDEGYQLLANELIRVLLTSVNGL